MKVKIPILFALLTTATSFARLGETSPQWKKRFESAQQVKIDNLGIYTALLAEKGPISVVAVTQKNVVIYERYTRWGWTSEKLLDASNEGKTETLLSEINEILLSLSDGKKWTQTKEMKATWDRPEWTIGNWKAGFSCARSQEYASRDQYGFLHVYSEEWVKAKGKVKTTRAPSLLSFPVNSIEENYEVFPDSPPWPPEQKEKAKPKLGL